MNNIKYEKLNPQMVTYNLINLKQITFEVTDVCNLKCKYCGYGELYNDYDKRIGQKLSKEKAIRLLEYLDEIWKLQSAHSYKKKTYISFYGGEPLLNMSLIKTVVDWFNNKKMIQSNFIFNTRSAL